MKPYKPVNLPLTQINWESHIRHIGQANSSLARFDGILTGMVNPKIPLSPLTTQEAVLSSKIEGTQASLEEVLEFEVGADEGVEPDKQADIHEIINYRQAMNLAIERLNKLPLCLNLIRELHKTLLDSVRGRNKAPGEFRRIQNFIGKPDCTIENATFVPPSVDLMTPALHNWEKYLHFEEKDPLVQLAVAKAQFEIIHPFLDGNGRLGRMLVPLFLFEKKILSSPMFYLSAYFEANREEYYFALQNITRQGDWNSWITFFLNATIEQAKKNNSKARAILSLYDRMKAEIPRITRSQFAIQALDSLFDFPIFRNTDFTKRAKIPKVTSLRILRTLYKNKIIQTLRQGGGRRARVMIFPDLINIVDQDI